MKNKKKLIISILVIALVVIGCLFALNQTGVIHLIGSSAEETKQEAETNRQNILDVAQQPTNNASGNQSTDKSGSAPTGNAAYTPPSDENNITITAQQSGDNVVISTKLKGYSDGSCVLEAGNNGRATSQTVQVIYQPEFSTCAGFTLPVSSLGAGKWSVSLTVKTATTGVTKTITVDVK